METELAQAQKVYDIFVEFMVNYSFQIVGAIIIVLIGFWLSSKVGKFVERLMLGKHIDVTLSRFSGSVVKIILLVMVVMVSLGNLGISVTPFIAALGALGIGAGLALQGMLANYAAGFTIIITRPFVVGDTISVLDVTGIVESVHLGYIFLVDEDNVRIQIPNRHIVGEIIHNSAENILIKLEVGVAYDSDPDQVTTVILEAVRHLGGLAPEASIQVGIDNFGDFSINFGVRFWAPTNRHFEMKYAANLAILNALRAAAIAIPLPQREVRIQGD